MDTQYKDLFSIIFYQKYTKTKKKLNFHKTIEEANNDVDMLSIEENRDIDIIFNCIDINARFYMDGLDVLPENIVEEDEVGNIYLRPSNYSIPLVKVSDGFYPLIPGKYRIKVCIYDETYYSIIRVKNKLISEEEADLIKNDLESEINGLAFELIRRNLSWGEAFIVKDLPIELVKFFIIKKRFSSIMSALMDLRTRPNYKIISEYKIVSEEKVRFIDETTIKNYLRNSIKEGFMKVPNKKVEYNLPENKWIKKIIKYIKNFLDEFIVSINKLIEIKQLRVEEKKVFSFKNSVKIELKEEVKNLNYLIDLYKTASKMKNSINILRNTEWYNDISDNISNEIPHVLIQDPRYNILYKSFLELKKFNFNLDLSDSYNIQWKRTDVLYEIWCYIKICRIIKDELGFNLVNGWIFDEEIRDNNILIPELSPGTRVSFKKEDIIINFIYDSKIPHSGKETSRYETPLFITAKNNRPDGRLDIYRKGMYIGSLLFEFKYRTRELLWKDKYIEYYNNSVIRQLIAYSNSCSSPHIFAKENEKKSKYSKYIKPVSSVFILYPKSYDQNQDIDEIYDHNLKFIKFKPKKNKNILAENINIAISEIVEESKNFL